MKLTRILALLLALTLALCIFSACGKEDDADKAKDYRLLSKAQLNKNGEVVTAEFGYERRGEDIVITASTDGSPRKAWTVNKAGYFVATSQFDPNGNEYARYEADYDENGRRTAGREYEKNVLGSSATYEYDGTGKRTKVSVYGGDGQLKYYTVYLYDTVGNLIDVTTYAVDGSVNRIQYYYPADGNSVSAEDLQEPTDKVFERDGDGKVVKVTVSVKNEVTEVYTYEYDGEGRLTKETRRDRKGAVSRTEYTYGENGKPAKEVLYDKDGSVSSRVEYAYDGKGALTKKTTYDADGNVGSRYEYVYGEDGALTKETVDYSYGGYKKEYDANGNLTSSFTYNSDGSRSSGYVLEYLDRCVSKYTYYDSDGSIGETIEVTEFTEVSMTEAQYQGICRLFHQDGVLYH